MIVAGLTSTNFIFSTGFKKNMYILLSPPLCGGFYIFECLYRVDSGIESKIIEGPVSAENSRSNLLGIDNLSVRYWEKQTLTGV